MWVTENLASVLVKVSILHKGSEKEAKHISVIYVSVEQYLVND